MRDGQPVPRASRSLIGALPTNAHPLSRAPKTAEIIAQRLASEIAENALPAGTVLAPERDMSARFGVGRGSLREGLRLLEQAGIISMKPGPRGGPVVAEPDARSLARSLALMLQAARTPFRSIVEARALLEPQMAGRAATRATPEQIDQLQASVDEMAAQVGDLEAFLYHNTQFHDLIAWSSGNDVFAYLLTSIHWITDGTPLGVHYDERRRQAVHRAHVRVFEAIRDHDAETATAAMARHISEFQAYMEKYYPLLMDRPVRWEQVTS
jgi:DNA-binding FadR family transcriptional regulator